MVRGLWLKRSVIIGATVGAVGMGVVAARPAVVPPASAAAPPSSLATLVAEKAATMRQMEAERARAPRGPKTPPAPGSFPAPQATWGSGIEDIRQPPYPGFVQANEWEGIINGKYVAVHAGVDSTNIDGSTTPEGPGLVAVTTLDCLTCDDDGYAVARYPDPGTVGPLKITSVHFPEIELQDAKGGTTSFNAQTHMFSK